MVSENMEGYLNCDKISCTFYMYLIIYTRFTRIASYNDDDLQKLLMK